MLKLLFYVIVLHVSVSTIVKPLETSMILLYLSTNKNRYNWTIPLPNVSKYQCSTTTMSIVMRVGSVLANVHVAIVSKVKTRH